MCGHEQTGMATTTPRRQLRLTCLECSSIVHIGNSRDGDSAINRSHRFHAMMSESGGDEPHLPCMCQLETENETPEQQMCNFLQDRCCTIAAAMVMVDLCNPDFKHEEPEDALSRACKSCLLHCHEDGYESLPLIADCTDECCPGFSTDCLFTLLDLCDKYGVDMISEEQFNAFRKLVTADGAIAQPIDVYEQHDHLFAGQVPQRDAEGMRQM